MNPNQNRHNMKSPLNQNGTLANLNSNIYSGNNPLLNSQNVSRTLNKYRDDLALNGGVDGNLTLTNFVMNNNKMSI